MIEPVLTAEDEARAMLRRMGVDGTFSSGDLVELANVLGTVRTFTWDMVDALEEAIDHHSGVLADTGALGPLTALADLLESLLPPRTP